MSIVLWFLSLHIGTASLLEIVWSAVAIVGLGLTLALLREARLDRRAVQVSGLNGGRARIARANVRSMQDRVIGFGILMFIGLAVLLTPTNPKSNGVAPLILGLGLTIYEVRLMVSAVQDARDRSAIAGDRSVRVRKTDPPPPPLP